VNWFRSVRQEGLVYTRARRRLETVSSEEVLRYVDNTHAALGQTVAQLRKSLSGNKADEALPLINELWQGTETIRAAADVLKLR